jgi:hypothetical protein
MADAETGISRDAFLSHAGQLAEELVDVPGLGKVLCRELTAGQQLQAQEALIPAMQEDGKPNLARYQQMILQLGLIDPADGKPLLDLAGATRAMELGASKVDALVSAVQRLSAMGAPALETAEKNSATIKRSSTASE